jgi:hypothetical protein
MFKVPLLMLTISSSSFNENGSFSLIYFTSFSSVMLRCAEAVTVTA